MTPRETVKKDDTMVLFRPFRVLSVYKEQRVNIKRREFLGFFLIGSLVSLVLRKLGRKGQGQEKVAMFWRSKA
jgi:hypothetical protein